MKRPVPALPFTPLTLFTLLAFAATAVAEDSGFDPAKGFGIGILIGHPSGLSGSLPLDDGRTAVHVAAGYAATRDPALHLQADHVWVRAGILPVERGTVSFHYGPGAFLRAGVRPAAGLRAALGLDYRFEEAPLQAFVEIAPGVNVVPDTEVGFGGGLGFRYYF